jgi:FtsH-binding integral membrane protein
MGLFTTSLIQIFIPFSSGVDLVIAGFSVLLFSGFVLYDTQQIMKRLSSDEWVMAALSLYLDFINLFLSVLRVVSTSPQRNPSRASRTDFVTASKQQRPIKCHCGGRF